MNVKAKIIYLCALGLVSGLASAVQLIDPPSTPKVSEITVFVAKKIVTMDPSIPNATAVAVSDGRILSVGSLEDMKPWTDKYPTKIDRQFANKVMYPGFIEPHAHPLLAGLLFNRPLLTPSPMPNPWGTPFAGVPNLPAAIAQLKKYSDAIKDPNEILLTWGYDVVAMGKQPDRQLLDQASTTRPIIVWDISGHDMYVNSATIKHYGITPDMVKNIKGVGLDKDGQLNGQFLEIPAMQFILKIAGKDILKPNEIPNDFMYINDLMQQAGITTSGDLAFGTMNIDMETKIAKAYTTSPNGALRIVPVVYAEPFIQKYGDKAIQEAQNLSQQDNDRLIFQGVKFYSDGGYLPETMRMESPGYTNGTIGSTNYQSAKDFAGAMKPWWDAGFHIHIHSNGDVGNAHSINSLQLLLDSKPRFDHRYTINHFGIPSTAMVMKIKTLGAVVSANMSYISERAQLEYPMLGVDRASYATRLGTLVRSGIVTSIHSDAPVSAPAPLKEAWTAVTRRDVYKDGKVWAPADAVTASDAMKMITINAAYTLGVESKVGSIEAGKFADFAVLDSDPQAIPAIKIKDVAVHATVLGGKVIPVSETKKPRPMN
ncbi:amidohydrolase family protein [Polynucleobacter asymbioticus]|uniref:amidohydrolase n=1 Tax=Polynucleobacter asymbioticus TaxID=576611 RepID=UPI001BFD6D88|nr:amidohydrolase family protein [Polynucleobacter asymbioticus]QWD84985.1 amidohydrolase family protein [Polynucleobacter asymbioticus]